jgi:hypothetical protein
MKRVLLIFAAFLTAAQAHDIITTPITFDREISRILYDRCNSCHHPDGKAFSLMTYSDARPWAVAIKEEVLSRRMPPWGAVKGFGDFRNDKALTPEQLEVITSWVDGGVPEGEEKDLPPPPKFSESAPIEHHHGDLVVSGEFQLTRPFTLDGLVVDQVPDKASLQVTAELPDGAVEPVVWIENYKPQFAHPFLLRIPLELPKGSIIHGVPEGARLILQPPSGAAAPAAAAHAPKTE